MTTRVYTSSQLRPFTPCGLSVLEVLDTKISQDERRAGASIKLLQSGSARLSPEIRPGRHRLQRPSSNIGGPSYQDYASVVGEATSSVGGGSSYPSDDLEGDLPDRIARSSYAGSAAPSAPPTRPASRMGIIGSDGHRPSSTRPPSDFGSEAASPSPYPSALPPPIYVAAIGDLATQEDAVVGAPAPLPPPDSTCTAPLPLPAPTATPAPLSSSASAPVTEPAATAAATADAANAAAAIAFGGLSVPMRDAGHERPHSSCSVGFVDADIDPDADLGNPSSSSSSSLVMDEERTEAARTAQRYQTRSRNSLWVTLGSDSDGRITLQEAYELHSYNFDADGDGKMGLEEILHLLDRCGFFDDFLTQKKATVYMLSLLQGCNHVVGVGQKPVDDGFEFQEFEQLLQWIADMKMVPFDRIAAKVTALSSQICDQSSSVRRKLEVVFQTYAAQEPGMMNVFELSSLCSKAALYEKGKFCTGDAHHLFHVQTGYDGKLDFEGFLVVISEIGERLGIGSSIHRRVAIHCDTLKADESMLTKLRARIRLSASTCAGREWDEFFRQMDEDGSGTMAWDEFYRMCRTKLGLRDHDNHLRTLFSRLDEDTVGEISLTDLIHFVSNEGKVNPLDGVLGGPKAPTEYVDAYEIDVKAPGAPALPIRPIPPMTCAVGV